VIRHGVLFTYRVQLVGYSEIANERRRSGKPGPLTRIGSFVERGFALADQSNPRISVSSQRAYALLGSAVSTTFRFGIAPRRLVDTAVR